MRDRLPHGDRQFRRAAADALGLQPAFRALPEQEIPAVFSRVAEQRLARAVCVPVPPSLVADLPRPMSSSVAPWFKAIGQLSDTVRTAAHEVSLIVGDQLEAGLCCDLDVTARFRSGT